MKQFIFLFSFATTAAAIARVYKTHENDESLFSIGRIKIAALNEEEKGISYRHSDLLIVITEERENVRCFSFFRFFFAYMEFSIFVVSKRMAFESEQENDEDSHIKSRAIEIHDIPHQME